MQTPLPKFARLQCSGKSLFSLLTVLEQTLPTAFYQGNSASTLTPDAWTWAISSSKMESSPLPATALNYNPWAGEQSLVLHSKEQTTRNRDARNSDLLVYRNMVSPSPFVSLSAATANTVKSYIVPGIKSVISALVSLDIKFFTGLSFATSIQYV